ncbi:rRNA maturation RNase YbeY [soil metagenome]
MQTVSILFETERLPLKKVNYIFCSDDYLLHINKAFLQHDYYTDIITFDLSEKKLIIGEIYISIDRVRENAEVNKASFKEEILRVIFHGALHLCGYNDKTKSEVLTMRQKERFYIDLFLRN